MSKNEAEKQDQELLSPSYIKELEEMIELSDTYKDRITDWEHSFLASFSTNLERYGQRTRISVKQAEILERISAKLYAS